MLTKQQQAQEEEYVFPYHYLDLESDRHRLIGFVPLYSRNKLIAERLGNVAGLTILDAGCGDGRFCYDWRNSGAMLIGADYSERAIAFARAFVPGVEFHVADIADLEMYGRFDKAVLIEVLEHIHPDDCSKFLATLAGSLKPGGQLILTVPSINRPVGKKHYRHFDEALLRSALSESFNILSVGGYNKNHDWKLSVRKRFARIGFAGRKRGLFSPWVTGYADWYHKFYAGGLPHECRGLIAVAEKKVPTSSQ